jgi:hypothetical protein
MADLFEQSILSGNEVLGQGGATSSDGALMEATAPGQIFNLGASQVESVAPTATVDLKVP